MSAMLCHSISSLMWTGRVQWVFLTRALQIVEFCVRENLFPVDHCKSYPSLIPSKLSPKP